MLDKFACVQVLGEGLWQKEKTIEQPLKNTSSSPKIAEGSLCSFCYFCGKEFVISQYESHTCYVYNFDTSDNDNLRSPQELAATDNNSEAAEINNDSTLKTKEVQQEDDNNCKAVNNPANKTCLTVTNTKATDATQETAQTENTNAQSSSSHLNESSLDMVEVKEEPNDSLQENESFTANQTVDNAHLSLNVDFVQDTPSTSTSNSQKSNNPAQILKNLKSNQASTSTGVGNKIKSSQSDNIKAYEDKSKENVGSNNKLSEAGTSLSSKSTPVSHETTSFQKTSSLEVTFCEFCGLQNLNPIDLKSHQLTLHETEHFKCFICLEIFNDTSELIFHQKIKHYDTDVLKAESDYINKTKPSGKDQYRYYCNQCGKGFDFIHLLFDHKKKLVNLGSHFLEGVLKVVGLNLGKNQTKSNHDVIEKRTKATTNSLDKKSKYIDRVANSNNARTDKKASKFTEGNSENKNSKKDKFIVEKKKEMAKDKYNKQDKEIGIKKQKTEHVKKIKEKNQEDITQTIKTFTDDNAKSPKSSNNQSTSTEKQIDGKCLSNSKNETPCMSLIQIDKKQEKSNLGNTHAIKNTVDTIQSQHGCQYISDKQKTEKLESKSKTSEKSSEYSHGSSENKSLNEKKHIHSKSLSKNEHEKNQQRDDKNSSSSTAKKEVAKNPTDYHKIHHKKIVSDSLKQDNNYPKIRLIDQDKNIRKESDQKQKDLEKTHKYRESDIKQSGCKEKLLNLKGITIRPLCVLLKREKIENMTVADSASKNKNISKNNRNIINLDPREKKSGSNRVSDGVTGNKETLLKISKAKDKKGQYAIGSSKNINIQSVHSSNNTNNMTFDTNKIKRIIKECDIFSFSSNIKPQAKQDLRFVDKNVTKKPKQLVDKTNNIDITEKPKEVEQEVKKRLSLQQYKQIRNYEPSQLPSSTSLILTRPQISEQAMQIINEVTQKIEIFNTLQQNDSNNAQFSDDDTSEYESSQEKPKSIFCEACGHQCQNLDYLKEHMSTIHAGFHFVCFVCDHHFSTLDAVINHQVKYTKNILMAAENQFLRQRKIMPNMPYPYFCNNCGKGFTLIDLIAIHKKQEHDEQVKKKALIKKAASKKKVNQVSNQSTVAMTSVQNQPDRNIELNENQTNISNHSNFAIGINEYHHLNNETIPFTDALEKLDDPQDGQFQNLANQNTIHTTNDESTVTDGSSQEKPKSIFCEACGHQCQNLDYLKEHMSTIHAGFHFVCFVCDHHFSTLDAVINHQVKYTKNILMAAENQFLRQRKIIPNMPYPYFCNHCGKGFTLIDLIAIHKKQEHDEQVKKKTLIEKAASKKKVNQVSNQSTVAMTGVQNQPDRNIELNENQTNISNHLNFAIGSNEYHPLNNETIPFTDAQEKLDDPQIGQFQNLANQNTIHTINDESTVTDRLSDITSAVYENNPDPNFPRFCESCGLKHLSFADQQKDLHLEKFRCIICRSPYETIDLLVTHYDRRHPKHEVANFEYAQRSIQKHYSYYCKFCGQGFYFIGELLEHKECEHFELLQMENDNRSVPKSNEDNKFEKILTDKEDTAKENDHDNLKNDFDEPSTLSESIIDNTVTVTTESTTLDQQKYPSSDLLCNNIQNNKSLNENQTSTTKTLGIDNKSLPTSSITDGTEYCNSRFKSRKKNLIAFGLEDLSDISDTTIGDVNSPKTSPKNDNVIDIIDLSILSDSDSDSSSLVIDLDNISHSIESKNNVVEVEEFLKEKQKEPQEENQKNDIEKPNMTDVINSTNILVRLKSEDWDEVAKQLADEVTLMAEENFLENSQEEKLTQQVNEDLIENLEVSQLQGEREFGEKASPVRSENPLENWREGKLLGDKALVEEENLLENCHEDVVEIVTSSKDSSKKVDIKNESMNKSAQVVFCEACGQKFSNKSQMNDHFRKNHKPFRCSVCSKRFTLLTKLIKHQTYNYTLPTLEYAEQYSLRLFLYKEIPTHYRYYCFICGQGFNLIYDLKYHKAHNCSKTAIVSTVQSYCSESAKSECDNFLNMGDKKCDNNSISEIITPSASCSKNENIIYTAQNSKDNRLPNTNIVIETKATPTCSFCGKNFSYWHLLNEHRAIGCTAQNSQNIKNPTEQIDRLCNIDLNRRININSLETSTVIECQNKFDEDKPPIKSDSGFLIQHQIQECPTPEPKTSYTCAIDKLAVTPVSKNANNISSLSEKTFKCPVCPHKDFGSEEALKQHSNTSQRHIRLIIRTQLNKMLTSYKKQNQLNNKNKSIYSQAYSNNANTSLSKSLNLPVTCLISEIESPTRETASFSRSFSYLETTRHAKSWERRISPSRARSRSPPRSRKRTELSDIRRKSIDREEELKKTDNDSKKKKKKSRKRRHKSPEGKEHEAKRHKKNYRDESTETLKKEEKLYEALNAFQKLEKSRSSKRYRSQNDMHHSHKTREGDNNGDKKKNNDLDDLEGIYTLKELEKICPGAVEGSSI